VKDFRESLSVVAGDYEFVVGHLMEHTLAPQKVLREPGVWQRNERVQLCLILEFLAHGSRHHDSAGANIEPQRLRVDFFWIAHEFLFPLNLLKRIHPVAAPHFGVAPEPH
jgi:hypothetical protein